MLLLALARVQGEDIAADYALSSARLTRRYTALGEPDQGPDLEEFLAGRGTSAAELILDTLASLDLATTLRRGGLKANDIAAVRERVLLGDTDGFRA